MSVSEPICAAARRAARPDTHVLYLTIFPVSVFKLLLTAAMGAGPLGEARVWRGYLLPRLLEHDGKARAFPERIEI